MTPPKSSDAHSAEPRSSVVREDTIEYCFIGTLQKLKYEYHRDVTNRATLEANFREKFEALTRHFAFNQHELENSARLSAGGAELNLVA